MGVRNCAELGANLQKIISRLLANNELINLLYYENDDPLSQPYLSTEQKQKHIFEKLVRTIPRMPAKDDAKSVILVYVTRAARLTSNKEFKNVRIVIDAIVPQASWYIKDSNLRPFAILGQIQNSLDNKTINGLGKISGGDFDLNFITDDVVCYQQVFEITEYD